MHQFQKSHIALLDEFETLVDDALAHSEDRRQSRKLKGIRKEIKKWQKAMEVEEKLQKQERLCHEEIRKQAETANVNLRKCY